MFFAPLCHLLVCLYGAIHQPHNPVSVTGIFILVRDLNDRDSIPIELPKQFHHLAHLPAVEIASRVVCPQQPWLPRHRQGNGHQVLPAAVLTRKHFNFGNDVEAIEETCRTALPLTRAHAFEEQRCFNIFVNGELTNEVICVEDETNQNLVDFTFCLARMACTAWPYSR